MITESELANEWAGACKRVGSCKSSGAYQLAGTCQCAGACKWVGIRNNSFFAASLGKINTINSKIVRLTNNLTIGII